MIKPKPMSWTEHIVATTLIIACACTSMFALVKGIHGLAASTAVGLLGGMIFYRWYSEARMHAFRVWVRKHTDPESSIGLFR
jgi:energy-converting hydrogenase Eha subunit A